jgi:hypothetical protein
MTMQPQPTSPSDRSTTFQAVEGNQAEQYNGGTLLVVAYSALWLVLFAWVALVWRKQSALNTRLADLERVIDKAAADADAKAAEKK